MINCKRTRPRQTSRMIGPEQTGRAYIPPGARSAAACLLLFLLLAGVPAAADELTISVDGIGAPLLGQVEERVAAYNVSGNGRLTSRRLQQSMKSVELEAETALRPFGYYHPLITSSLTETADEKWQLKLHIDPGPPLLVTAAELDITGPGAGLDQLQRWKKQWPLGVGKVMDQTVWESQKQAALELCEAAGYLSAEFTRHLINADLETNQATTVLVLETGPQAVLGSVVFNQDVVEPGILEQLPRFKEGQAYDSWLLEKFHLDLWRTGYFSDVEIIEERRLEESPPRVNLVVNAEARNRDTYQGSLGYGTDTEVRMQLLWTRHLLSSRGDSLDTGIGWQQRNNEYTFKSNYRLPRRSRAREFWIAEAFIRRENQDLEVRADDDSPDFIELTNGDVVDYAVKAGKLVVRDLERGYQQIFETWYGQYVLEKSTYSLQDFTPRSPEEEQLFDNLDGFRETSSSLAFGINWDWPVIHGRAFQTHGHHERAWVFTSNTAWGSDRDFTQAYISSNWTRLLGPKFKLLLRGEVGYTDADVQDVNLDLDGELVQLSVTELPNIYRFKTGGSQSVRGYAFESLSNNGIGSNNVITASSEIEWNFRPDWAAATFFDIGNAFNDWSEVELKKGWGVGLRWYSIVGPIRLDIAQALDLDGHPWTVHFTIGTPLL